MITITMISGHRRTFRNGGALETELIKVQGEMENTISKLHGGSDRSPEDLMKVKMQIESLRSRSKRLRDEIALAEDFQNQLTESVSQTVKAEIKAMVKNQTKENEEIIVDVVNRVTDTLMKKMENKMKKAGSAEEEAMEDAIRRAQESENDRTKAEMVDEPLRASGSVTTQ